MTIFQFNKSWSILIIAICFIFSLQADLSAEQADPQLTGLPELTEEELEWQNKHMLKVKKVKLNGIGLDRINQWRKKKGKNPVAGGHYKISRHGEELEVMTGATGLVDETTTAIPQADMPGDVDNSTLKFFPPVRTQGSLNSCGVFNGTYYAMTHMYAMVNDIDAKNGGDGTRFSPKWTYNMVNGGTNAGTWYYWAYEIGQKHGSATWSEFPYDGDYKSWNLNPDTWEAALYKRFNQYGYVDNTHTDTGIEQVKQMLLNGYVLNIPTYIESWKWQTISDDPGTTNDDAFAGKNCATWVNGTLGYHAMTVVGYNDDIWVDINNNGTVDAGEKGAFKIANSWGTGWGEAGFAWMAYDALKNPSAVEGGPSSGRVYGWSPSRAHWVTARAGYAPRIIGKFTLNHAKRDQIRVTLGISDISQTAPEQTWYPEMIYNQGGALGFSGTATAVDGTFVFDFTDILPSGGGLQTFYLGVMDDTSEDPVQVKSFTLIDFDNGYIQSQSTDLPLSADAEQVYATVDYDYFDGNLAPEAVATASVISGTAPLHLSFDGSGSMDSDGSIVSWQWDFGDGASQSGSLVTHTYDTQGEYTATLTVTDDMEATSTTSLSITVLPNPDKILYISDIEGTINTVSSSHTANVIVHIMDMNKNPISGAQVTGFWSGLISGDTSSTTGDDGSVTFTSRKTRKTGSITWTATSISASGYTWDSGLDLITSVTMSTDQTGNQAPTAVISATPVTGTAPLQVTLDGTGATDSDGFIDTYTWKFEDGTQNFNPIVEVTYDTPGTYTVNLTVTDDQGASHTESIDITVTSGEVIPMHITDITMSLVQAGKNISARATVSVADETGAPVPDATIYGTWSGLTASAVSGTTDALGQTVVTSDKTKKSGTFTFTVNSITCPGYIHTQENDITSQNSINNP